MHFVLTSYYKEQNMDKNFFILLFKRFLQGKSTEEEKFLIDQWYDLVEADETMQLEESEIKEIGVQIWQEVQEKTKDPSEITGYPEIRRKRFSIGYVLAAAAIFSGLVILSFFLYYSSNTQNSNLVSHSIKDSGMIQTVNFKNDDLKIILEDGSVVFLEPSSKITYPKHFKDNRRDVYLEGNAFFEISKNRTRPFYVYNKQIITHVLGTSFTVRNNKNTNEIEVSVRTGRVEVYENSELVKKVKTNNNGVVLLPNQKVVYNENARKFIETLVDVPLPIKVDSVNNKEVKEAFIFYDKPLSSVLNSIEKMYGIEIVAENEAIYNCPFTGDITQQNLFNKMDIICKVMNISYEIKGTKILLRGKGCW